MRDVAESKQHPNSRGITLVLCGAAALLEGFDNQSTGVAAPRLIAEFGLSAAQSGLIFSGATLGLYVARLLTGLGLGGSLPNYIALSAEATSAERRVGVVTVVIAAMPMGGALAGLMALGGQLGRHAGASQVARISIVLFGGGRAPTTLMLWASFFFTQLVLPLILNWLPSLIIGLGFTHAQASWAAVWFNLAGSLGAGYLGYLHAGPRRRVWVVLTYAGSAPRALTWPAPYSEPTGQKPAPQAVA